MNKGIPAAFVPQTEREETRLAVHTHRRRGWRRVAMAAAALAGLGIGVSRENASAFGSYANTDAVSGSGN